VTAADDTTACPDCGWNHEGKQPGRCVDCGPDPAADDPTLGGLLGPQPKRALHGPDEECSACHDCPGCGGADGSTPKRSYLRHDRGAVLLVCADCNGDGVGCPNFSRLAPLPNAVSVPGKTLADDAAEHDRGLTW
jgi:hypothetical protein